MNLHKETLALVKSQPGIKRVDVARHLGIKPHQATYILDDLVCAGKIFRCEATGGYFANADLSEPRLIVDSVFINRKYA